MKSSVEIITPSRAKIMLSTSTGNRRLRDSWVVGLVDIIKRGEWQTTHQGIAVDANGHIRDGHHRLTAIAKSGMSVPVMVTYGVPVDSFAVMDCGLNRNLADRMQVDKRIAEPLGLAFGLTATDRMKKASAQQALAFYDTGLGDILTELVAYCGTARRSFSSAPVKLAAAISIMNGEDKGFVFGQYKALVTLDFDVMTNAAKVFFKQAETTPGFANKTREVLTRAFRVFDSSRINSKICINENQIIAAVDLVRSTMRPLLKQERDAA